MEALMVYELEVSHDPEVGLYTGICACHNFTAIVEANSLEELRAKAQEQLRDYYGLSEDPDVVFL